jgi:hypothetical protein
MYSDKKNIKNTKLNDGSYKPLTCTYIQSI